MHRTLIRARQTWQTWQTGTMALWLCALAPGAVQAKPECPTAPIRLALYEVGLYYNNGVGLDKDIADELKKRSGCSFDITVMPRVRIFKEMEAGRMDMATSVLETPERTRSMWLANYIQLRYYAILGPAVPPDIHSMEDLLKSPQALQWSGVRCGASPMGRISIRW